MKLFGKGGKLNIIDVILIVILIAAVAFVAIRFLSGSHDTLGSDVALSEPNLTFTVVCEDVDPMLAESILASLDSPDSVLDGNTISMTRLFNSNKLVDAQVVAKDYTDGKLSLTVSGKAVYSNGAFSIGTQEVRIGKIFNVKTLDVEIEGIVYAMEKLG
ncbi:MAG: DUF4330 family protein [Ruminococcaceae bacterium]|nr:DUF4330 family protein [Oscillospiraceae bacterium]